LAGTRDLRQRSDAIFARAPARGGETGAGPIHWYENYNAKNSRAWLGHRAGPTDELNR